ncbi:MAG: hypothetical protein IH991_01400 [Planctomycetes bacterium]|nr:hypothetical protein [Planctomycetota bacterium]
MPWFLVGVLLAFCHVAGGQEKLLRWKFKKGQTLNVVISQTSHTETTVKDTKLTMDLSWNMEMTWTVEKVGQDGSAEMTQSFTRMTIEMTLPKVGTIKFDSAAKEAPEGFAEEIADRIGPLIGAQFKVKMNNRGAIVEVHFPEEILKQLEESQPSSNLKGLLNRDGIDKMLRQSVALLPEKPISKGDRWKVANDTPSPIGVLRQSHEYTYAMTEIRDNTPLEKITVNSKIEIVPKKNEPASKTKLKKQQQSGVLYFDHEAGRFVESSINQELTSETPFGDLTIHVKVKSSMKTRFTPADNH